MSETAPVRFSRAIDLYIVDQFAEGRINSPNTEREYRGTLNKHAEDVDNRDPAYTNRDDVKRTLSRWPNPNTQSKNRSIPVSFYDWTVEEGHRPTNPARQTRRPRRRKPSRYRLTRDETMAVLEAVRGERERRLIYLAVCAGLRRQELIGMQGRHFRREGWLWVSQDIGKGHKERWVPVIADLEPVWRDIATSVADNEYVLPAQRFRDPGINKQRTDYTLHPSSEQAVWRLVGKVVERAGIAANVTPHSLRHAYCDHVARHAGLQHAQQAMGHANLATTELYLGTPTLDELAAAMRGVTLGTNPEPEHTFQVREIGPTKPEEAPTGIEPVYTALQAAA